MLEDNEERFNKTIKFRKLRIQAFCISIGIVLSYILYLILKINIEKLPEIMATYMSNKYVLIFGQWFVAILLGNIFSYWYILSVYRPLLPSTKYAGYNKSTYKSVHKDTTNLQFLNFLPNIEISKVFRYVDSAKDSLAIKM